MFDKNRDAKQQEKKSYFNIIHMQKIYNYFPQREKATLKVRFIVCFYSF